MSSLAGDIRIGSGLRSMTGYAVAMVPRDGLLVTVSLRSVNHRFLDLHVQLPELLFPLERSVRKQVQERNPRGHLSLKVTLEQESGQDVCVNEELLRRYVEVFRRLAAQYGLSAEFDPVALSQLPGVLATAGRPGERGISSNLEAAVSRAVEEVLNRWDAMRAEEAKLLAEDVARRLVRVRDAAEQLETVIRQTGLQAQKRLQERLQALLGQTAVDPSRLAQEAAVLADRADTTEEILRLRSHVAQVANLLEDGTDAGRKFDFLLQEMHRELTTLLSKAAGLGESGLAVTRAGLDVKAEVEKIREQVQNLQ